MDTLIDLEIAWWIARFAVTVSETLILESAIVPRVLDLRAISWTNFIVLWGWLDRQLFIVLLQNIYIEWIGSHFELVLEVDKTTHCICPSIARLLITAYFQQLANITTRSSRREFKFVLNPYGVFRPFVMLNISVCSPVVRSVQDHDPGELQDDSL